MNISVHQPDYIPNIGYFYKISKSDIFVYLDDAQFSNDNMHHWNRLKSPQGEMRLKIPLNYHFGDTIRQIHTKDELHWKEKHLKMIDMNYARNSYYKQLKDKFSEVLLSEYQNLAEMNISINTWICSSFGLHPRFVSSSELNIKTNREQRVLDICKSLSGTTYISGNGARSYQVKEHFSENGIKLLYTDYTPFEYPQQWKGFLPDLSILDYIFNFGFNWDFIEQSIKKNNRALNSIEMR